MATLDLTQYGITGSTVIAHNPSYETLFAEETKAGLTGFDKGVNTELAVGLPYQGLLWDHALTEGSHILFPDR